MVAPGTAQLRLGGPVQLRRPYPAAGRRVADRFGAATAYGYATGGRGRNVRCTTCREGIHNAGSSGPDDSSGNGAERPKFNTHTPTRGSLRTGARSGPAWSAVRRRPPGRLAAAGVRTPAVHPEADWVPWGKARFQQRAVGGASACSTRPETKRIGFELRRLWAGSRQQHAVFVRHRDLSQGPRVAGLIIEMIRIRKSISTYGPLPGQNRRSPLIRQPA